MDVGVWNKLYDCCESHLPIHLKTMTVIRHDILETKYVRCVNKKNKPAQLLMSALLTSEYHQIACLLPGRVAVRKDG